VKRICILLAGVALAAVSVSAVALARPEPPTAHPALLFFTVQLRHTRLGKVLANAAGYTLFEFTKDRPKKDTCLKIKGCLTAWPEMPVQGKPSAGPGLRASLLSTINTPGGIMQVTYAGHPLYIHLADRGAGRTSYVGKKEFGGKWYAVNAKGHAVK
jgi:predicted lipoprotein with Yx(FWY)xxD motif